MQKCVGIAKGFPKKKFAEIAKLLDTDQEFRDEWNNASKMYERLVQGILDDGSKGFEKSLCHKGAVRCGMIMEMFYFFLTVGQFIASEPKSINYPVQEFIDETNTKKIKGVVVAITDGAEDDEDKAEKEQEAEKHDGGEKDLILLLHRL